jgi:TolB-like protein/DNA-binding winged helix-turn-helix (wHTH) protein/Tfp pilus assembly protein PilF
LVKDIATPQPDVVEDACAYVFGPFRLVTDQVALLRDGAAIPLRPKSFDVLHYLVRHPQRLVSRDELLRAVWSGVVVTDDSLTQCLIEIRKALDDRERSIVRTVPRRGYLFDVPVQVEAAGRPSVAGRGERPAARPPSRWTLVALLVLAVAVGATWWRPGAPPTGNSATSSVREPPAASIAVLPFTDMSPEGDQEYLGDGIAEEILNLLAQVPGLTVIARTSSFSFKGQQADIGTIARRLSVAHVLEGSVRKSGDRVRVTAQLVDGADGSHLWSQTFEERLQDVFTTQDQIARNVTAVLQERLLGQTGESPVFSRNPAHGADPQAWELYLRGKYFLGRRMQGDLLRAHRYLEQALAIDPGLVPAWVALAANYNVRRDTTHTSAEEMLSNETARPLIRQALERALALDPDNPEGLLRVSGFTIRDGDRERGLEQIERAMRNGRNNALVQTMLAGVAFAIGDVEAAVTLQRRGAALDPVSTVIQVNLGFMLYAAGRLHEAAEAFQRAWESKPEKDANSLSLRVWIAIHQEDLARAADLAAQLPQGTWRDQAETMLAFRSGDSDGANKVLERLQQSQEIGAPAAVAYVHAFRGETDEAFRWLQRAAESVPAGEEWWESGARLTELRSSPFLQPLHGDPRWPAWLAENRQRWHSDEVERVSGMLQRYLAELAAE